MHQSKTTSGLKAIAAVLALALGAVIPAAAQAPAAGASSGDGDIVHARGVFEVRAYGAVGDGRADDTDAIQRTIEAAGTRGVVVLNPPSGQFAGKYLVTHPITIDHPMAFLGLSRTTQIVVHDLSRDIFQVSGSSGNIDIRNFQVLGVPDAGGAGGNAFRITRAQNVRITDVAITGMWNGVLNESSGALVLRDVSFAAANRPPNGQPRYGFKATAAVQGGNPNSMRIIDCNMSNYGAYNHTVDGYVIADGYNSVTVEHSGALAAYRSFWSTSDGGRSPNFFILTDASSDHSAIGIELDDGGLTTITSTLVTSAVETSVRIAPSFEKGPINMYNDQIVSTVDGINIEGGRDVTVTGGQISRIGKGDAIRVGTSGTVAITGVNVDGIANGAGVHVLSSHRGSVTISGNTIRNAGYGVLVDGGTPGSYAVVGNTLAANRLGAMRDEAQGARRSVSANVTQ